MYGLADAPLVAGPGMFPAPPGTGADAIETLMWGNQAGVPTPQTFSDQLSAFLDLQQIGATPAPASPSPTAGISAWISANQTPLLIAGGAFIVLNLLQGRGRR